MSTKILLVQGVTKYLHKVELSKLDKSDEKYAPLYLSKHYREGERQIDKHMAKMQWFKNKNNDDPDNKRSCNGWKDKLKKPWCGSTVNQRPTRGMNFTTLLQVPNTSGGLLLRKLAESEHKLSRQSGYNVRLTEKSGIQLCRLFQRVFTPTTCHWERCPVCRSSDGSKSSKCRIDNIVYEGRCEECEDMVKGGSLDKGDVGVYIGESGRTLAERSQEHINAAKSLDESSFVIKHWILKHPDLDKPPMIKFSVKRPLKDALSRLVCESVWIEEKSNMNSKSEWRNNKVNRLTIEDPEWLAKKKKKAINEEEDRFLQILAKKKRENNLPNEKSSGVDNKMKHDQTTKIIPVPKRVIMEKRKSCTAVKEEEGETSIKRMRLRATTDTSPKEAPPQTPEDYNTPERVTSPLTVTKENSKSEWCNVLIN